MRRVVVLPHPEAPSSEKNSPAAMSRSMPLTAGMPPNDFFKPTRRIAPPVTSGSAHCVGEPGEVAREAVDVGIVVLDGQQPLLHLSPRRKEDAAVVLHEPVCLAEAPVDKEEVAIFAHPPGPERDATLRTHADEM